jgi:hypothetical protein
MLASVRLCIEDVIVNAVDDVLGPYQRVLSETRTKRPRSRRQDASGVPPMQLLPCLTQALAAAAACERIC